LFGAFQPENVSCEIKISNLPTALSEHLAGANGAADDLVYVVGGIIFANDFPFAGIRPDDTDRLNGRIERLSLDIHYAARAISRRSLGLIAHNSPLKAMIHKADLRFAGW
jgi:hypothetical protein